MTLLTSLIPFGAQADSKPLIGFHQDATYYGDQSSWNYFAADAQYTNSRVVRSTIRWRDIEPNAPVNGQHSYKWIAHDGAINTLLSKGIPTVGVISSSPQWANGNPDDWNLPWNGTQAQWDAYVAKYATFAGAVASRFKGRVTHYEIWNEPNEKYFWKPAPETNKTLAIRRYGQLFTAARQAIAAKDPSARVALGGITGLSRTFHSQIGSSH